jgi:uncharacterized phage-associated protein
MRTNIYRNKLINVVLFFSKETKHLNITKLMKLLNFFDFEHFRQTGYPSIGLEYFAFEQGPVPRKFWLEVKDGNPPEDLSEKISIDVRPHDFGRKETLFQSKRGKKVDFDIFSPRERKILENLAFIYKDVTAKEISQISHDAEEPWEITIKEKGLNASIDYLLAIGKDSALDLEEARENLHDHFQIIKILDIDPVQ